MLVDQQPIQIPQGRGPNLARIVHLITAVKVVVGQRVDRHVKTVGMTPDSGTGLCVLTEDIRSDRIRVVLLVCRYLREHQAPPVAPALAHAAALDRV